MKQISKGMTVVSLAPWSTKIGLMNFAIEAGSKMECIDSDENSIKLRVGPKLNFVIPLRRSARVMACLCPIDEPHMVVGRKYKCSSVRADSPFPKWWVEGAEYRVRDIYQVIRGGLFYLKGYIMEPVYVTGLSGVNSTLYVQTCIDHFAMDGGIESSKYPHKCPKCGGPAYIGFSSIDCRNCS